MQEKRLRSSKQKPVVNHAEPDINMKILVLIKPVPDPDKYNEITIDQKTKRIIRDGVPMVVNPEDKNALEAALRIGGRITVLAMAPEAARDKLVECLAMGADEAYLLADKAFGGADTYATSYVLSEAIRRIQKQDASGTQPEGTEKFDLILAGNGSADGATSHVPVQVAEWLGITHIAGVCSLEKEGELLRAVKKSEDVLLTFEGYEPAVIAVTRETNKPRLINAMGIIRARKKPLTVWSADDLELDAERTGLEGSPTQPGELITPETGRKSELLAENAEEAAKAILEIAGKAGVL